MADQVPSLRDLLTILYRPRQTFRRILDGARDRWTIPLVVLAYLCAAVSDSDIRVLFDMLPGLPLYAALALITLGFLGVAAIWVGVLFAVGAMATFVGRFLDGRGTAADVRAALAWGVVPVIWSVFFRIPFSFYFQRFDFRPREGRQMFFEFVEQGGLAVAIVFMTFQLVMDAAIVFVASNTLAEALGFSPWKGLATLGISIALPIALIVGVTQAI